MARPDQTDKNQMILNFVYVSSFFYGLMTLLGLAIIYFTGGDFGMFEWSSKGKDIDNLVRIVFLTIAILYCLGYLIEEYFADYRDVKEQMVEMLSNLPLWAPPLLGLASGVGEEVLFRGALQPLLGWVATSVVFGLVHLAPATASRSSRITSWSLATGVAGLLFGYVFLTTQKIIPCIAAHALINCLSMYWMIWEGKNAAA